MSKTATLPQLPLKGVDSHAHLNFKHFKKDLEEVIQRARKVGVKEIGQVFLSPDDWKKNRDLFASFGNFFFLLGIHPTDAHKFTLDVIDEIKEIAQKDELVKAIGEIGLDYHWKDCPPEVQKEFFVKLLRLAKECSLPVAIHSREAEEDTVEILLKEGMQDYPLLWHCFGGGPNFAQKIFDYGWHISIPGTVTFNKNDELRATVAMAPKDRLLIETDCPFLSPMPYRGKRNEPSYLAYTIQTMAEARKESAEDLWTRCGDNARSFFKLNKA